MKLDYSELNNIINDVKNKKVDPKLVPEIKGNMYPFAKDFLVYLENLSAYEVASIIHDVGHWQKSRKKVELKKKPWKYQIRDIVELNLGSTNYGYEASYKHPCIVYANLYDAVLVIPCSTGRYSVNSPWIIKGEPSDGFLRPTGIQLDKIRIVDKFRIRGKVLGQVANPKFNAITNQLINLYFNPVSKRIKKAEDKIAELTKENEELQNEILQLKKQIEE